MHSLKFRLLTTALAAGLAVPVGLALAQNANQANQQDEQNAQQQTRPLQNQQRPRQTETQPGAAQQTEAQQSRQAEQDAQQAREAAERQAQQEGRERPTETETAREYADQQQRRGEDRGDAMRHFLAGYYAGYSDGYFDGSDDLVFHIVELQRSRAGHRDFSDMHPEHARHRGMAHERLMHELSGRGPRREQQLTGRVLNTREVSFGEGTADHMVVFVETSDGVGRVVDLGPVDRFENVQIEEGAEISVRGETFMAGDRRILAASQVQIGEETIEIRSHQHGQDQQQSGGGQSGTQRRAFRPEDTRQDRDSSAIDRMPQQRRTQQRQTGDTTQRQQEQQQPGQQAQPRGQQQREQQPQTGDTTQRQQEQQRQPQTQPRQQQPQEQQEREQAEPKSERPQSQP